MVSLIVLVDSIINIYDHFNVTPVPHVIRREANQLDLPTIGLGSLVNNLHSRTKFQISRDLTSVQIIYVIRSTEMRNKSGHVKSGKSTSKSVGNDFALKC